MKIIYCNNKYKPKRKSRKIKENVAKKFKKPFTPLSKTLYTQPSVYPELKSIETEKFNTSVKADARYDDVELAERERIAQLEIERKKKCVAPICNKSGYYYVGEFPDELVKNLGKKI
jgi:hypothetical protein